MRLTTEPYLPDINRIFPDPEPTPTTALADLRTREARSGGHKKGPRARRGPLEGAMWWAR